MLDDLFESEHIPVERIYRAAQAVVKRLMERERKKIEWVAAQLGTTKGYLYASLDPHQTHKPLSVDRIVAITELSGDMGIVEEIAKHFGYTLCRPKEIEAKPLSILSLALLGLDLEVQQGNLAKALKEALEDGEVDQKEQRRIKELAYELRKLAATLEESVSCSNR